MKRLEAYFHSITDDRLVMSGIFRVRVGALEACLA